MQQNRSSRERKYNLKTIPSWVPSAARTDLECYFCDRIATNPDELELIWRFLTDHRMKQIWILFDQLSEEKDPNQINYITYFSGTAPFLLRKFQREITTHRNGTLKNLDTATLALNKLKEMVSIPDLSSHIFYTNTEELQFFASLNKYNNQRTPRKSTHPLM